MSLRNNKATRLNRFMMFGMFFLGIIVLGCVFAFLYMSFNPASLGGEQKGASSVQQHQEGETATDSIVFIVNDSTLLEE